MFGKRYKGLGYCMNKNEDFVFLTLDSERLAKSLPMKNVLT